MFSAVGGCGYFLGIRFQRFCSGILGDKSALRKEFKQALDFLTVGSVIKFKMCIRDSICIAERSVTFFPAVELPI